MGKLLKDLRLFSPQDSEQKHKFAAAENLPLAGPQRKCIRRMIEPHLKFLTKNLKPEYFAACLQYFIADNPSPELTQLINNIKRGHARGHVNEAKAFSKLIQLKTDNQTLLELDVNSREVIAQCGEDAHFATFAKIKHYIRQIYWQELMAIVPNCTVQSPQLEITDDWDPIACKPRFKMRELDEQDGIHLEDILDLQYNPDVLEQADLDGINGYLLMLKRNKFERNPAINELLRACMPSDHENIDDFINEMIQKANSLPQKSMQNKDEDAARTTPYHQNPSSLFVNRPLHDSDEKANTESDEKRSGINGLNT